MAMSSGFTIRASPLKHNEAELDQLILPGNGRIFSRVVSRLDGFVSADAPPGGGSFETPLLVFTGNSLKLNVQVRPGGTVRWGCWTVAVFQWPAAPSRIACRSPVTASLSSCSGYRHRCFRA